MRERDMDRRMFHAGHYNVVAARIKDELGRYTNQDPEKGSVEMDRDLWNVKNEAATVAIIELTFVLARRFEMDNALFEPELFMKACSPDDVNLYQVWLDAGEDHG